MVYLDVREPSEFAEGHVEGALNVPVGSIANSDVVAALEKDQPITVYCRSGGRAGRAKQTLEELGFTNVTNGINQQSIEY